MPRRSFKVGSLSKNAGEALIDIPHFSILRFVEPEKIISNFIEDWGVQPSGVVLPVVLGDGFLFPIQGLDNKLSQYASINAKLKDFCN